ncbi:hypothetical protein [Mitsuaria sp. 7]|uniref:Tse2 family ADP-ribosyltransferase toxin n=1 Tax=Mitsuaria sp. 7 TaxID=1658665 RepID=UPI0018D35B99|nr:hypothetical protein [Mitsuaria sp. 7]
MSSVVVASQSIVSPEDLYILDVTEFSKDFYRMGNGKWPLFTDERARVDVPVSVQNGVEVVIANGNGFSAFDTIVPVMRQPGRKVWRIMKGAVIPSELVLVKDLRLNHTGHYMIAPATTMPLKKYLGALEELGMDRSRVQLIGEGDSDAR